MPGFQHDAPTAPDGTDINASGATLDEAGLTERSVIEKLNALEQRAAEIEAENEGEGGLPRTVPSRVAVLDEMTSRFEIATATERWVPFFDQWANRYNAQGRTADELSEMWNEMYPTQPDSWIGAFLDQLSGKDADPVVLDHIRTAVHIAGYAIEWDSSGDGLAKTWRLQPTGLRSVNWTAGGIVTGSPAVRDAAVGTSPGCPHDPVAQHCPDDSVPFEVWVCRYCGRVDWELLAALVGQHQEQVGTEAVQQVCVPHSVIYTTREGVAIRIDENEAPSDSRERAVMTALLAHALRTARVVDQQLSSPVVAAQAP